MGSGIKVVVLLGLVAILSGCGQGDAPPNSPSSPEDSWPEKADPRAVEAGKKYLLADEPAAASGVIGVRRDSKDGDEVIVAGQIGGSTAPFTEGRASFLLVDDTLKASDDCDCPWDFCGVPKKELVAGRISVKFVENGKTVPQDAREMFGVKELSKVVVKGKVQRDDNGNVVVVAGGVFVRSK